MTHDRRFAFSRFATCHCRAAAVLLGLSVAWVSTLAFAQGPDAPRHSKDSADTAEGDLRLVEPFVGEATFLILKVDPRQVGVPRPPEALAGDTPQAKAAFAEFSRQLTAGLQELRSLANGQPLYATVDIPGSRTHTPLTGFRRQTSEENAETTTARLRDEFRLTAGREGDYLVARPPGAARHSQAAAPPATRQAIVDAFASVREFPVQLLVVPPEHVWRTVRELSPELPRALGGGPSHILTDGVRWVAIGIDPERLRMEIHVQSANQQAARDFATYLPTLLRSAYQSAKPVPTGLAPHLGEALLASFKPEVEGGRVTVRVDGFERTSSNLAVLGAVKDWVEESTRRQETTQSFRRILIAMHNYHDVHESFPPADRHLGKDGKRGLSWRVHLLPFLDELDLYRQFRLDEPWDSAHNKPLLARMPDVYARLGLGLANPEIKQGHTTFLAPVGKGTIFGGEKGTKFSQIKDGTSNTIALVEVKADRAVPWTAPRDHVFDPDEPLQGVLIRDDKWMAAFADGSVRFLSKDLPHETVLHLFQMNDGQLVDLR